MKNALLLVCLAVFFAACAHPMFEARKTVMPKVSKTFNTSANEAYNAVRWALKTGGYNVAGEDLKNGVVTSSWLASKVDSFYIAPFGHPDYGVNGSYYQLEIFIVPEDGKTRIDVVPHVKSVVAHFKSSGIEEKKVLDKVADYLRTSDIRLTNLGLEE